MSEPTQSHTVATGLAEVQQSIAQAVAEANRESGSVQLLAVSKKKPLSAIESAWQAGQRAFGENYVDEALEKIEQWQSLHPEWHPEWHFIGAIQSRKAAAIATHFDWVHSVDRLKVAKKLAANRPSQRAPLNVCIQVNLDNEGSKAGLQKTEVAEFADDLKAFPELSLRGLMSIPAPRHTLSEQRAVFRELAELQNGLLALNPQLDTLSMGMSGDLNAAILEGATIVRIGTAIFGERDA